MTTERVTRALTEGVVIVVSILLAFGLEASWAARLERQEEAALLQSIRSDVVENRSLIAQHAQGTEAQIDLAQSILAVLAEGERGPASDSVVARIGDVFISNSWDPINDTYLEAMSSGRLALIDDSELRLRLARYQRRIDAVAELFTSIRTQYYGQLEPFLVAHTVYSDIAMGTWSYEVTRMRPPHETDFSELALSREFWNLLTLRLELAVAHRCRVRGDGQPHDKGRLRAL